ncbi:MAG: glycosyltransferase [Planctomycetota bacterium]
MSATAAKRRIVLATRTMACGGAETAHLLLAEQLVRAGHEVTVMTTGTTGAWFDRIAEVGAAPLHVAGRDTRHPLRHALRCAAVIRAGGYDVALLSNSERFAHAAAATLPQRTAVIPWIHSDDDDAYRKALVARRAWNVAVAVSPRVAAEARRRSDRPVEWIPNGVSVPADVGGREHRGFEQPAEVLFAGRLDERSKGVLLLPRLFALLRERRIARRFHVVGDGPDRGALEEALARIGIAEAVQLHGAQPREALLRRLLASHVAVMPSRFEGLPTVPIEAQILGCVPVATRLEGVTDAAIRDGATGVLVDERTPEAFAAAVTDVCASPARWQQLSDAGRAWAPTAFAPAAMAARFATLFDAVDAGRYPAQRSPLWPVDLRAFTWREHVPRALRGHGVGRWLRRRLGREREGHPPHTPTSAAP